LRKTLCTQLSFLRFAKRLRGFALRTLVSLQFDFTSARRRERLMNFYCRSVNAAHFGTGDSKVRQREEQIMARDKSKLKDDDIEFGNAGRIPSPLGGGGTTNIGGGTSGAPMGNADAVVNPTHPIDDVVSPSIEGDTSIAGGITDDEEKDL
jgi:hypothetical protein